MRYKVNFHVLLYFLSSCSTMMASQVPNLLNQGDSKTSSNNTNTTNDTKEANTFLLNVNNSNHSSSSSSNHFYEEDDTNSKATFQRTTHLASTNDRIATALATNNETNHTKIQTSKFIMLINWHSKSKMLIIIK